MWQNLLQEHFRASSCWWKVCRVLWDSLTLLFHWFFFFFFFFPFKWDFPLMLLVNPLARWRPGKKSVWRLIFLVVGRWNCVTLVEEKHISSGMSPYQPVLAWRGQKDEENGNPCYQHHHHQYHQPSAPTAPWVEPGRAQMRAAMGVGDVSIQQDLAQLQKEVSGWFQINLWPYDSWTLKGDGAGHYHLN